MNISFQKKFTMIEILLVCAIIAVLAGLVLGITSMAKQKAAENKTKAIMLMFEQALNQYSAKYGFYPPSEDGKYQALRTAWMKKNATTGSNAQKNNLNQFLDMEYLIANGTVVFRDSGKTDLSEDEFCVEVKDGFSNAMFYCSPGKFNTSTYDLGAIGVDNVIGESKNALTLPIAKTDGKLSTLGKGDDVTNFKR